MMFYLDGFKKPADEDLIEKKNLKEEQDRRVTQELLSSYSHVKDQASDQYYSYVSNE